jgi:hypothetical protein
MILWIVVDLVVPLTDCHVDDGVNHVDSFFFVEQEYDENFVVVNHTTKD